MVVLREQPWAARWAERRAVESAEYLAPLSAGLTAVWSARMLAAPKAVQKDCGMADSWAGLWAICSAGRTDATKVELRVDLKADRWVAKKVA